MLYFTNTVNVIYPELWLMFLVCSILPFNGLTFTLEYTCKNELLP